MEKETTYKISLSKYYEQFQTGNGEIDAPEITEQLQNEINECIKEAVVVAINGVNMSRLDHQPIVAGIEEDSFGDWLFGINFKLGASADGLYIMISAPLGGLKSPSEMKTGWQLSRCMMNVKRHNSVLK